MKAVHTSDHRHHAGNVELNEGELVPCFESPLRAEIVLAELKHSGIDILAPRDWGIEPIARVHDRRYLSFLETAFDRWSVLHGERDAIPFCWPTRHFSQRAPEHIDGALGFYSFDAGTPIVRGTFRAAYQAAQVALTAQALVSSDHRAVFALCRPPGHHAAKDLYGGYCYLNNAAIAAQAFSDQGRRVVVLDVDYHHGNGTQQIFYDRDDVLFISIHADPSHEYPYYLGYADEIGEGRGVGFNLNLPLPFGTSWMGYRDALEAACERIGRFRADALVLSLGADTFEGDPISRFRLELDDFARMGDRIAALGLETVIILEGGYAVEDLGRNVVSVLSSFR